MCCASFQDVLLLCCHWSRISSQIYHYVPLIPFPKTAICFPCTRTNKTKGLVTDLRDTLAVLATVQNGPGNAAGVLALEEERLGLAVLEAEDLAVATDVQLTLNNETDISNLQFHIERPRKSVCAKKEPQASDGWVLK